MEIAENNAQRITLVQNARPLGVFVFLGVLVLCTLFTVGGLLLLFFQVSEIVAPTWAESHRASGFRWYPEGSAVPNSLAVSVAISLFFIAFNLFGLWLGGTRLLFSIRRCLVFDFRNGQIIVKQRGLFRCNDRIHPISGTFARIEEDDDDGSKFQVLRVTVVPNKDQRGWSNFLPWRRTVWSEKVEPDQVKTLSRLF